MHRKLCSKLSTDNLLRQRRALRSLCFLFVLEMMFRSKEGKSLLLLIRQVKAVFRMPFQMSALISKRFSEVGCILEVLFLSTLHAIASYEFVFQVFEQSSLPTR